MDEKTKKVVKFLREEGYECYENDSTTSERMWLYNQLRENMCDDEDYTMEELTQIIEDYADGKFQHTPILD